MAVKEEDFKKLYEAFKERYEDELRSDPDGVSNMGYMEWKRVYKTIYTKFNLP